MWVGLISEAGEIDWLGRVLMKRTGEINKEGYPVYRCLWTDIKRDLSEDMICYVGLYDDDVAGEIIGMVALSTPQASFKKGDSVQINFPIKLGKQLGLRIFNNGNR